MKIISHGRRTAGWVYDQCRFSTKKEIPVQTAPGKGWNTLLRLYSPLEPFFSKQWRPSEIELVK
jgi:hypothetical protein